MDLFCIKNTDNKDEIAEFVYNKLQDNREYTTKEIEDISDISYQHKHLMIMDVITILMNKEKLEVIEGEPKKYKKILQNL